VGWEAPTGDPQTLLRCRAGPGVGAGLKYAVYVDPASVASPTPGDNSSDIVYTPPAITDCDGCGARVGDAGARWRYVFR